MPYDNDEAKDVLREYDALRTSPGRANFESLWKETARICYPEYDEFYTSAGKTVQGERKGRSIYDCSPVIAIQRFSAIMKSLLVPRNRVWHGLRHTSDRVNRSRRSRLWMEQANNVLYQKRYAPTAGFDAQTDVGFQSLGAFGNMPIFTDRMGDGYRYKHVYINDLFWSENHQGIIDTCFRRLELSNKNAARMFANPPQRVLEAANHPTRQHETSEYVHCVKPNDDFEPGAGRGSKQYFRYSSMYVHVDTKQALELADQNGAGGYNTFPYEISRYVTGPYEVYGRGPAMMIISEIGMLNAMRRSSIRAGEKAADPPLIARDDGFWGGSGEIVLDSAGINAGYIDENGRPGIMPLMSGANVGIVDREMEYSRRLIDDAFLISLFQIMQDNPRMSATEAAIRAQEKGAFIAPTIGRQETEFLGPLISRELDIAIDAGWIDPPPDEILENGMPEVVYDNPLSRLAKAEENAGLQQTFDAYIQLGNISPEGAQQTGFNLTRAFRRMAENRGVPTDMFESEEAVQQAIQQRQAQQAQLQQVQMAPDIARATKDLAQAQKLRSQGGM